MLSVLESSAVSHLHIYFQNLVKGCKGSCISRCLALLRLVLYVLHSCQTSHRSQTDKGWQRMSGHPLDWVQGGYLSSFQVKPRMMTHSKDLIKVTNKFEILCINVAHRPLGLPATHTRRCFWRCFNLKGGIALHLSPTIFSKLTIFHTCRQMSHACPCFSP